MKMTVKKTRLVELNHDQMGLVAGGTGPNPGLSTKTGGRSTNCHYCVVVQKPNPTKK